MENQTEEYLMQFVDTYENNEFPERLVLENVEKPEYLYTLPRFLGSIMSYIEENVTPDKANQDLMNIMGISYTYICDGEKIYDYPNEDMWRINELGEALDNSMRYYGRDYLFIEKTEALEYYEQIKKAIVVSINNGVPVLAGNVCGIHDFSIITGYDKHGDLLTGWAANMHHAKQYLENGMFIKEYSFISYGEGNQARFLFIKDKNGSSLSDKEIIENAVKTMGLTETQNKDFEPPYKAGIAALSAFNDEVSGHDTKFFDTDKSLYELMFENIFNPRAALRGYMADLGEKYSGNEKIAALTFEIQEICGKTMESNYDMLNLRDNNELTLTEKCENVSASIVQFINENIIIQDKLSELIDLLP